jgi:dTDP-4-amino-4,6-dideoxygalactose transaminase
MIGRFEKAFCDFTGHRAAAALSSGTGAMDIALRLLDVGPGDEVWVQDLTFVGGASPIIYRGATPVFIDVSPDTWTMDVALLADALDKADKKGQLPKVVIPVDLYGQSCDLDEIIKLCDQYGIPVVVDSAEAMGAHYKGRHAGTGATMAIYSFNGNKIITTSGGGMLASDDEELIARARYLSQQARQPVIHYEHTEIGYNYRMPSLCAAVGVGQLEVLPSRVARRREIFNTYAEAFRSVPGITMMPEADYGVSNRWLTALTLDEALISVKTDEICKMGEQASIECRPVWMPMSRQPVFSDARAIRSGTADALFRTGLCLPSGTAMVQGDIERVVEMLLGMLRPE